MWVIVDIQKKLLPAGSRDNNLPKFHSAIEHNSITVPTRIFRLVTTHAADTMQTIIFIELRYMQTTLLFHSNNKSTISTHISDILSPAYWWKVALQLKQKNNLLYIPSFICNRCSWCSDYWWGIQRPRSSHIWCFKKATGPNYIYNLL